MSDPHTSIDHEIFATVQEQIERDSQVKEGIRDSLKSLEKQLKLISSLLSRVHSVAPTEVPGLVAKAEPLFDEASKQLHGLIETTKAYPYYKYNGLWARDIQNLVFLTLFYTWLERMYTTDTPQMGNALLTIEECLSTSRLRTSSTSRSKSIFTPSSRWWRSWPV